MTNITNSCSFLESVKQLPNQTYRESIYLNLIQAIKTIRGESSPLIGLVLIELSNFYVEQGRDDLAQRADDDMRKILREYLSAHPEFILGAR